VSLGSFKEPLAFIYYYYYYWGSVVVKALATSWKVSGSIPIGKAGIFFEATDGTMCPGVDSASKNEYQENSWG
jgi:hypothetical protein